MNPIIDLSSVSKSYGEVRALNGLTLQIAPGELFGLIGPDGAGKTTLMRILTTLILPDGGRATVDGQDLVSGYRAIRRSVGYMPGRFSLYADLTVEENLRLFATVFGTTVERNYELIEDIYRDIEPFRKRRAGRLSGGMKQKLALSCALIHKPRVLFLDEPTTGVDATSRRELWHMLGRLREQGITIVVSTPYMDEARLCDRVALLSGGTLLDLATPDRLVEQFGKPLYSARSSRMYPLLKALRQMPGVESCYAFGDVHHATFSAEPDVDGILRTLRAQGFGDVELRPIRPTIEDCYLLLSSKNERHD